MKNYASKLNVSIKLVFACTIWHAIAANGYTLKHDSLSLKIPPSSIRVDIKGLISPGMVFGSCHYLSPHQNETPCFFGMETKSNVGSAEHVRYCNFTHTTRLDGKYRETLGILDQIVAIDDNKAAFTIGYSDYADLSIIHFSDCRVIPVDVTGVTHPYPGAPFNATFDIFSFKKGKDARTVVDFEGNFIEEHREINEPLRHLHAVVRSPAKGYLAVRADRLGGDVELVAYNSQGSMEVLKRYTIDLPTVSEVPSEKYTFSVINKLVTVCGQRQSKVRCAQFDQNGVLKFEITIPFEETSNKYLFHAYNLEKGGLLFVSFKCIHGQFYACSEIEDHITMTTFDGNGRQVGSLQIKEVNTFPTNVRASSFFMNEKRDICLSSFRRSIEIGERATLDVVCFTSEELINSE